MNRKTPDRREFLTDEAYRLHKAEVAAGQPGRRRRALAGFVVALLFALAIGAILFLSGCATSGLDRSQEVQKYRAALPFISTPLPTGSMRPILVNGQQIRHWWEPYEAIKVGDLVGRMNPWGSQVVIHRVIRNDGTPTMPRWVTKGDHNDRPDAGYLFEDAYVGKWSPITPVGIVAARMSK